MISENCKILIVEDDIEERLLLKSTLEAEGYQVLIADTGLEALSIIKDDPPDLVLLDVMGPNIHGYELCRLIKCNEESKRIVVVFISALDVADVKIEGLDMGADDFITKPFNTQVLMARLRSLLRVQDTNRKLEKLVKFAQGINSLGLEQVADSIQSNLDTVISAERYSVFVANKDGVSLELLTHNHTGSEMANLRIPIKESPIMFKAKETMEMVIEKNYSKSIFNTGRKNEKYDDDYAICMPLKVGNRFLGVLNINGNKYGFFDNADMEMLALISELLSSSLNNIRQLNMLKDMAITDGLTKLLNHRFFYERLHIEFERAKRFGNPLSCLIMDIDYFKKINDKYGHQVGDLILKELANRIRRHLRKVDIAARYGGEEFAVLLPQTTSQDALVLAERIRQDIYKNPFETVKGSVKLTVSIGICDVMAADVLSSGNLLDRADIALYKAKESGRNKTVLYKEALTK